MATVAGVKIKPKTKKITSQSIREHAKRDHSPKWDNVAEMTTEKYSDHFRDAMKYYRMESSYKELKPKVIDWMSRNDYTKEQIAKFKKTKDWRCHLTMGAVAANLLKGMPDVRADFNYGKSSVEWLRNEIAKVVDDGKYDIEEEVVVKPVIKSPMQVSIQDRVRETAGDMCEEIDLAIDSWSMDPDNFDPKAFKVLNVLRGRGAKAAHTRYIKGFYVFGQNELLELASGNAHEQLREGYKHMSRRNVKKMIDFYEMIMSACDQIAAEAKVMKKPRAKKVKPAEQVVAKLKFCVKDDKLGIVSTPPAQVIGAQGVVVYNIKTRKIGYYVSKTSAGFGVKGTSLTEFTDKSFQKTLRKPPEQIKEFKEQNTQRRFETWFAKNVKTTETLLNGRFNEDTVILKVFK